MGAPVVEKKALEYVKSLIRLRQCLDDSIVTLSVSDLNNPPTVLAHIAAVLQDCAKQIIEPYANKLESEAGAAGQQEAHMSYIQWLPDGAVDIVVRHMSDRPRSR